MEKKPLKIRAVSYVHVGDDLVNTEDLTDEQRRTLANWITITMLNERFKGTAEFYEEGEKTA